MADQLGDLGFARLIGGVKDQEPGNKQNPLVFATNYADNSAKITIGLKPLAETPASTNFQQKVREAQESQTFFVNLRELRS